MDQVIYLRWKVAAGRTCFVYLIERKLPKINLKTNLFSVENWDEWTGNDEANDQTEADIEEEDQGEEEEGILSVI